MELKNKELMNLLEFSLKIAGKSTDITLEYFGKKIRHKLKKNLSPVTKADIQCEEYLVKKISRSYPSHSILAEESGTIENNSEFKWIIDPVDGTKNFMRGYPFWGTLLAVEHLGEVVIGVISMPALGEVIYAAKGFGCFRNNKKIKVSKTDNLEDSYLLHGGLEYIYREPYCERFMQLVSRCNYDRGFGDCHGHSLIIKGKAEFMIDPHVAPYDIAATKICVEEAGGRLTDIYGNDSIYNGTALISNGKLHNRVLGALGHG